GWGAARAVAAPPRAGGPPARAPAVSPPGSRPRLPRHTRAVPELRADALRDLMPATAVGYVREEASGRGGPSLADQSRQVLEHCRARGYQVAATFVEPRAD